MTNERPDYIASLVALVRSHLSDDLLTRDQRERPRRTRTAGHCYVASETLWHLLDREPHVYQMQWESNSHWFLYDVETLATIDATADQFAHRPMYGGARRRGFLTRAPSRRAEILLARVRLDPAASGITMP